jgi:hypothetical protein
LVSILHNRNFLIYLLTFTCYRYRKQNMENKIVDPSDGRMEVNASLKAVNTKMKFIETSDRKIAYRSIGKGLPIIMVNRFRGN